MIELNEKSIYLCKLPYMTGLHSARKISTVVNGDNKHISIFVLYDILDSVSLDHLK
jgi:hypothetical protein